MASAGTDPSSTTGEADLDEAMQGRRQSLGRGDAVWSIAKGHRHFVLCFLLEASTG